jgi:uncharacterized membrane protein
MQKLAYEKSITKIISTLSKTEKQVRKSIEEIENTKPDILTEENDTLKLLSIKTENTLEILKHFNSMLIHTICTIHNINKVEVK